MALVVSQGHVKRLECQVAEHSNQQVAKDTKVICKLDRF